MAPHLNDDESVIEGTPNPVTQQSSDGNLQMEWKGEYTGYDTQSQNIYVNGRLKAPLCPEETRKPIDVVIVLDRSGSMRGPKLDLCLKTIEFLIHELAAQDRLSIVTYDTNVITNLPLTKMHQKGKLAVEQALPRIKAGSATNLSGGLLQGIEEIQSKTREDAEDPNPVKSIMLLTDGMANHGIRSTEGIVEMVKGALREDVSLFTFGYGAKHNVDMLRQISDVGRGVYYFVKDIDGVSLAFADCLGGLLSVVAQNIKLNCSTLGGAEIISIKTKKNIKTIKEKIEYEIDIGDLYGEEERDFLMEVKLPAIEKKDKLLFHVMNCTLTFANILKSSFEEMKSDLIVERMEESKSCSPDSHVIFQKNRILTAEAIEKATEIANAGNMDGGTSIIFKALQDVTNSLGLLSMDDKESVKCLIDDLKACKSDMANKSVYLGGGMHRTQAKAQSHYMQRSNDISNESCARRPMMGRCRSAKSKPEEESPFSADLYRTKRKKGTMSKAFQFKNQS